MGSNEPLEEREVEEDVEEKGESEEMGEEMSEKPRRIGKRGAEEERKTESEDIWEIPAFLRRRKRR